jgi:phage-related protein (TIGR01555 family)
LYNKEVHHTRILKFIGKPTTEDESKLNWDGFGFPIYQSLYKPLARLEKAYKDTSDLLGRLFQDVLGLKNMANTMSKKGGREELDARIDYLTKSRGTYQMILCDLENEKIERISSTIAGVADIIYKMEELLSGEDGVPVYKIFGSQPKGFNASDEGGKTSYYDVVKQLQIDDTPNIELLAKYYAIILGIKEKLSIEWNPPWQLTEIEKSKIRVNDATAIEKYVNSGVMSREEAHRYLQSYEFYKSNHFVDDDYDYDAEDISKKPMPVNAPELKDEPEDE